MLHWLVSAELFSVLLLILFLVFWVFSSKDGELVHAKGGVKKFWLYVEGLIFMAICNESKGISKVPADPGAILKSGKKTIKKRIIFIRHGESDWNDVFNKGFGPSIFKRLFNGMVRESKIYTTEDSIFLDSPLNHEGFHQALEVGKFLNGEHAELKDHMGLIKLMRGEDVGLSSVIVSSNLRRAISTVMVAFSKRLQKNNEKILLLSSLQEISRNVDTKALSSPQGVPYLARISEYLPDFTDPSLYLNAIENHGNKSTAYGGLKRIKAFTEWVFGRSEDVIIVGGHSLWFKYYFQRYLPTSSVHPAKNSKIVNSGMISFDIYKLEEGFEGHEDNKFCIDEASIVTLYGGFEKKK